MNCYVTSAKANAVYPDELNKENTLFYPENGMTMDDLHRSGRPASYHIVTDSPFLVPLYSQHEVFLWNGSEWVNPDTQTYGTSYNIILNRIFGIKSTIPQAVRNGNTTNVMGF